MTATLILLWGASQALEVAEKIVLIQASVEATGRSIDLINLATTSEPLLGKILHHGTRLLQVNQYDVWSFYRKQLARMWDGIKALYILAVSPDQTAWLMEVKDCRLQHRTKPSELGNEVLHKVLDTLAALILAKNYVNNADEKRIAGGVTRPRR